MVGLKTELGKERGYIMSDSYYSFPYEIKQGWSYSDDGWHDAGPNDVILKATGIIVKPSMFKTIK